MNILNAREYIEGFLKIRTKDGIVQPLKLNPPQQRLYAAIQKAWRAGKPVRIIILKARQMGFSTLTEAIIFWACSTAPNKEAMIVAHKDEATANIFRMSKRYYDELPEPLKPMMKASNAQELVFDRPSRSSSTAKGLGSRIRCATAGGKGVGRSYTLSMLHLSEYAFWPGDRNETYTGLAQTVPDKAGTIIIIESTANGYDDFKRKWDLAVEAERNGTDGFTPIFFAWFEMPEYRRKPLPGFERTEEEEELAQRFSLDDEQLAWRRWAIAENCGGDINMFHQEYPSTPDEAFISTGQCAFDKTILVARREAVRRDEWERGFFRTERDFSGRIAAWEWTKDRSGPIRIRKHPEKGVPYVIGGDTAGTGSDCFVGQVLDNRSGEQVCVLQHRLGEREYAEQMYCLGMYYNEALIGIETNYSTYPELALEDAGYKRLYVRERVDTYTGQLAQSYGFATTSKTRPLIIDNLKEIVRSASELITDFETMGEMLTFVYDDKWRAAAEQGEHDDLVMALAIAHFIRGQQTTAVQKSGSGASAVWTKDQWEDFNHASPAEREMLKKLWGEPK